MSGDEPTRSLYAPARAAFGIAALTVVALAACFTHAIVNDSLRSAAAVSERLGLTSLCLMADEDQRHPGWGRAEQGRAGQPSLPDPRGPTKLVRPLPVQVAP